MAQRLPHTPVPSDDPYSVGATPARSWISTALYEQGISTQDAMSVVRERDDGSAADQFIRFGERDADAARLFLTDTPPSMMLENGHPQITPPAKARQCVLRNLRPSLHWRADHPIDLLSFVIPRAALDRWALETLDRPFDGLHYHSGIQISDEVIAGFGYALLPCLDHPEVAPRLFVDQVLYAVCGYLARTFGPAPGDGPHGAANRAHQRGGLAPWQVRRATDMIRENLDNQLSLRALAAECRLSVSHFTKAFRESVGQSPHQWLLDRRVEQARTMLATTALPLSEIATGCGFADQSHFSRAFARRAGTSPGAWRRAHRVDIGSRAMA